MNSKKYHSSKGNCQNRNKASEDTFVQNPSEEPAIQSDSPINEQHTEQINETGSVIVNRDGRIVHCLTIVGQIEGHYILPSQSKATKYEHVIPQLVSVEEDDRIHGLLILLNTCGGDVEAGLAIAEVIAGMKKPVVSIVLGGGHSIGIPLAVSSKHSFIAQSASMTVHPVRTTGLTVGAPQTFEYFRRMQDRITTFVSDNSSISKERYNELVLNTGELVLDIGTILEGKEAVDEGLIDSVGTLSDAMDCLYDMIEEYENEKTAN
ncbi:MAG: ATP-dependent Clp protease proteolytic subunit [Ruminococcus sp.]|nr:ATP-dependent Clp protease proteolytic subunit [Ruminococcus sp.]